LREAVSRQPRPEIGISIIVPVHNNPGDLRLCLAALRAAITPDAEIIVVDDDSTDDTPSVATLIACPSSRSRKTRVQPRPEMRAPVAPAAPSSSSWTLTS
jgi:hypothetical protein